MFETLIDAIKFSITEFFFKVEIKENKVNPEVSEKNFTQDEFQISNNQTSQVNTKSP